MVPNPNCPARALGFLSVGNTTCQDPSKCAQISAEMTTDLRPPHSRRPSGPLAVGLDDARERAKPEELKRGRDARSRTDGSHGREACTGARAWCRSTAARASDDASRRAPVHTDTGVGVPAARRYGWLCLLPLRSTATGDEQKIWDPITETLWRQLASAVRRQYFRLGWSMSRGSGVPACPGTRPSEHVVGVGEEAEAGARRHTPPRVRPQPGARRGREAVGAAPSWADPPCARGAQSPAVRLVAAKTNQSSQQQLMMLRCSSGRHADPTRMPVLALLRGARAGLAFVS
jgi:hypothetical protein